MGDSFHISRLEIAEHERAASELTRLRRKGIHCHLEERPGEGGCHPEVVRDRLGQSVEATESAASRKP